ncbi:hypothetical protein HAZT_HAZT007277 [Hyalella azteca]|uniref:C2H2-type domain-containing protein n=1 Tax=Hyalella azteca TaxID=294128 RepID=A0A6A0GUM8_HYAAZ|nr:hypothetical protein HAZT_HAZT007277 [Hyalella azteca]
MAIRGKLLSVYFGLRPKEEDQGSWELSTTVPAVDTPTIDTGEDRGLTALLSLAFSNKYIAADTEDGYAVGDSWSHSLFKPQNQDDDLNSLQSDLAPEGGMGPETSDGVYQCQVCSYRSHKRWDFMNHVRIHTGEKPFTCPYCPHRSALKNNMRRHIMLKHKLPFLQ